MVPVLLRNGTELRLIASVNALCDFEAELARSGFDPEREFKRIAAGVGGTLSGIRAMVWACAKDQHPGVGLRAIGDLLQSDGEAIRKGLSEAMTAAAPEKEEGTDPSGKATPPSD
ncbi:hypothetical protein LCM17_23020 [Cereibacter sphaeroides]|nr:hypothetical protein [Cereibacter sphaeroides]